MGAKALETRWFGVFVHEGDEPLDRELFPPHPEAIARRLETIRNDEILDEERLLLEGRDEVRVADDRLLSIEGTVPGEGASPKQSPADHGIDEELLHRAALDLAESRIETSLSDQTRHLVQAVAHLDESHGIENRMVERLTAWYRLHAPAIVDRVEDGQTLARLIVRHGDRASIAEALDCETEIGSPLDPTEAEAIESLAASIVQYTDAREPLERFVTELARDVAPNVAQLTTPGIAARLIRHAGGIEELGKLPASTIQMLGAERAVFQHLTEDAPPPKHGVIYRHPMIHEAHRDDRGSIARALAAKIAIAARADAFTGNDIAGQLQAELQARVDEIQRAGRRRAMRGMDR